MLRRILFSAVLAIPALLLGTPAALADPALESAQKMQQRAMACGADIGCIQRLLNDMQAQFGMPSPADAPAEAQAEAEPAQAVSAKPVTASDPCAECISRIKSMKQHGSVAKMQCKPLAFELDWDLTRKEIRTPASRIGPSTSVHMKLSERYPGCALISRNQNAKVPVSHAELSAQAGAGESQVSLVSVDGLYGLSRPYMGLGPLGDTFSTTQSTDPNHYTVDPERRQFGFDYQCNDFPGMGEQGNTGQVHMPGIAAREEQIVPPGHWSFIVSPELAYDDGVDLQGFLSCREIHKAITSGSQVQRSFPFKQISEFISPPGLGERTRTVESVEGNVMVRVAFGGGKIAKKAPKKDKKAILEVSPKGGLFASRASEKKPYQPREKTYTLTNTGDAPLTYSVSTDVPWLEPASHKGGLAPKQSQSVTVKLNAKADALTDKQEHAGKVRFVNLSGGEGSTSRKAVLSDIQVWDVLLSGTSHNTFKEMYGATEKGKSGTLYYYHGVAFSFDMAARVTLVKRKGRWQFGKGRITKSKTKHKYLQQPDLYDVEKSFCDGCNAVNKLAGRSLSGKLEHNRLYLNWPEITPIVRMATRFKLKCAPGPGKAGCESNKKHGSTFEVREAEFLGRARPHGLKLTPGAKSFAVKGNGKGSSQLEIKHDYLLKRVE